MSTFYQLNIYIFIFLLPVTLVSEKAPVVDDSSPVPGRAVLDQGLGSGKAGEAVGGGEIVSTLEESVDGVGGSRALRSGEGGGVELGSDVGEGSVQVGEEGGGVRDVVLAAALVYEVGLRIGCDRIGKN